MWQFTACDAASSYAMAKVVPADNARETATFLQEVVLLELKEAGWKLHRVLTDGGSEFKAESDRTCRHIGVRHTRTKPQHAWTNGFVERLQGTILHEHWRIPTGVGTSAGGFQLQTSLDGFPHFYSFERPHLGLPHQGTDTHRDLVGVAREHRHDEV